MAAGSHCGLRLRRCRAPLANRTALVARMQAPAPSRSSCSLFAPERSTTLMSTSFERRVDARFVLSVIACGIMSFSGVVVETAMNITSPPR